MSNNFMTRPLSHDVDAEAYTAWLDERPDFDFDPTDFEVTGDGTDDEPDEPDFDADAWNQGNKESELER